MSFPRYEKYKDPGVEWLGDVPTTWALVQLKRVASICYGIGEPPVYRTEGVPLVRATNVHAGRLHPEWLVFVDPSDIPAKRIVWLLAGDIIVVRSGAYTGDSAIIPADLGPAIAGFDMVLRCFSLLPKFCQWALLSNYLKSDQIELLTLRAAQPHLNAEDLGACTVAIPPAEEQAQISAFLDRETAKIDALVEEQQRLIELLNEELQCLVLASRSDEGTRHLRLGNVADVMERPVVQKEGELYRPLGMYNRGRGIFHKEPREMADMGDSDFFWVESGDLVISGQFAWEGAIGLAVEEEDGCVVSHRYPVLRGKNGIALTEYLFALMLTKYGDFILNESSWGAAGRNRPLNVGRMRPANAS